MGHKSGPEAPVCSMCHGHAGQVRGSLHHHARKQARWLAQGLGCPQPGKGGRDGGRARGQEEHAHCRSVGLQQECVPSETGQRAISDKTVLTKHTEHGIHARGQDGLTPHALFEPQTLVMAPRANGGPDGFGAAHAGRGCLADAEARGRTRQALFLDDTLPSGRDEGHNRNAREGAGAHAQLAEERVCPRRPRCDDPVRRSAARGFRSIACYRTMTFLRWGHLGFASQKKLAGVARKKQQRAPFVPSDGWHGAWSTLRCGALETVTQGLSGLLLLAA